MEWTQLLENAPLAGVLLYMHLDMRKKIDGAVAALQTGIKEFKELVAELTKVMASKAQA